MDPYQPAEWHDFFILAGTAAAALAGLVVVAVTLHLKAITGHPGHRHRARTILASLGHILVASLIVLIPAFDHVGAGVALVAVSGALVYETLRSSIQIVPVMRRWRRDAVARTIATRTVIGDLSMVIGLVGAVVVLIGYGIGLAFIALDMVVRFALAVAGSWLLIVAVGEEPEATVTS